MRLGYALLTVAVVATAAALAWWKPWSTSLVRPDPPARRAFGAGRVVHVVVRMNVPAASSGTRPLVDQREIEVWYDTARRRMHVVQRDGSKRERDTVTSSNALSPEPLRLFVLEYRRELGEGAFQRAATGDVQGRRVLWLQSEDLGVAVDPVSYQPLWLSLGLGPSGVSPFVQLAVAETKPYDPADFLTAKQQKPRHL
jgi:hypothetical protein